MKLYHPYHSKMNLISELPQDERDAWYECMLKHAYDEQEWENASNICFAY